MAHIVVFDEFKQPWKIEEDDELYQEAVAASKANGATIVWPLAKIVQGRGWGWWTTFKKIDDFEIDLAKMVPNPTHQRLVEFNREYTPEELRELLQTFGSHLSILHKMEGILEAQCLALKEGLKTGLAVAVATHDSKTNTVSGKEAEVMSSNELFKQTRRLQIDNEACLLVIKGWRTSYEQAFQTISRLITLSIGEASLATGRYA